MAIAWRITNRCNLGKCFFCRIGHKSHSSLSELNLDEIKNYAYQYSISKTIDNNNKKIYITGGEPFIRDDFAEIVLYITRDLKIPLSIVSNGTLLHEGIIKIIKNPLIELNISLDGMESVHNKIRNGEIFRTVISNIKKCIEKEIVVDILPTVTKVNYDSLSSNSFITLLNSELVGVRNVAFSQIDYIGYGKVCQNQNVSHYKYSALLRKIRLNCPNVKVTRRHGRPPSLRIDCEGNVHALAEMAGFINLYDGNLRNEILEEIIKEPSFFWLFHRSKYSRNKVLWELIKYGERIYPQEVLLSKQIIKDLNRKSYLG